MLHERLGIAKEEMGRLEAEEGLTALAGPSLPSADSLFDQFFAAAEKNRLEGARTLLAAALLARANEISEGRLSAGLVLLSRLVAKAPTDSLFGESTYEIRERALPNGWRHGTGSWQRFRYAWREGLYEVLGADPNDPIVSALDELTRLSPQEPEPVAVSIQEQSTAPETAFLFTMGGLIMSLYGVYSSYETNRRIRNIESNVKKRRR